MTSGVTTAASATFCSWPVRRHGPQRPATDPGPAGPRPRGSRGSRRAAPGAAGAPVTAGAESPTCRPSSAIGYPPLGLSFGDGSRRSVSSRTELFAIVVFGRGFAGNADSYRRRPMDTSGEWPGRISSQSWPTACRPTWHQLVTSAVFHYQGLGVRRSPVRQGRRPSAVAWLRIASAGSTFALWRRPWRTFARLDQGGKRLLVAWGVVLAVMKRMLLPSPSTPAARSAPSRRSSSSRWSASRPSAPGPHGNAWACWPWPSVGV